MSCEPHTRASIIIIVVVVADAAVVTCIVFYCLLHKWSFDFDIVCRRPCMPLHTQSVVRTKVLSNGSSSSGGGDGRWWCDTGGRNDRGCTDKSVVIEIYDAKIEFDYNLICYDDGRMLVNRVALVARR